MPKDSAYKQAEQKIAKALKSGATELDLSNIAVQKPYGFEGKEQVIEIRLTELPESIGQLTQLTALDFSNNELTTIPDSLGRLTQLTSLNLSNNQLTALPDPLGQLTQLRSLDLSNNQLTTLPDSLGQLTQLITLNLSENQLTALPDSLEQLTQLIKLQLSSNPLKTIPECVCKLTHLQELFLERNPISALPESIGHLTDLKFLYCTECKLIELPKSIEKLKLLEDLSLYKNRIIAIPENIGDLNNLIELRLWGNKLTTLPKSISKLKKLTLLHVAQNNLTSLPAEITQLTSLFFLAVENNQLADLPPAVAQLENLRSINLKNNPLNPALQSAYDACKPDGTHKGYEPLFAYLRSLEQNAEPLYEAKLVLVGEGNVGKTTLLKALKGRQTTDDGPREGEPTTHGIAIDIHGLKLPHPEKENIEIQLNAWDFGGQDVYRVTHQFFFSRRSLYLLVWEPRNNVQQGRLDEWLEMIRLRVGDEARVIIVSTHCREGGHLARIDKPVFKAQYGDMIVDFCEVDSLVPDDSTGEMTGIAALKQIIARASAQLPQMGMGFNRDWKAARDELITHPEPRISFSTFSGICAARGLSQLDADTLARLMHDLGYIVHYADDEKLRDDVVLKPEWLTKAIGFVLEDRATAEREGILPDGHLTQVWRDHTFEGEPRYDPNVYPFFLRLMEKYDVCYRLTDGKASLVAQHVPQVRPELPWLPEQEPPKDQRRIAMVCALEEDPPGLIPWMIVRTHDYAYPVNAHSLHWDKGMFLSHGTHGTAMLEKRGRDFHIYAQAEWPEHFMNVIHSTLEKLIADNWPGLKDRYRFMVPCPEMVKGEPCKGRFNITGLRNFLAEGDTHVRCQECSCKLSIAELLLGFEERDMSVQLREINEQLTQARKQIAGLDSRIADYFWATMHAIADEGKNGPRLFTLSSGYAESSLEKLLGNPMELQLWCEAEGCQHPLYDYGLYKIESPKEWVKQTAQYAIFAFKLLNIISPIAAPAINTFFGPKTTETWGIDDRLKLAGALISKLPTKIETPDQRLPQRDMLNEVERSGILALHRFLNEVDPTGEKLGLHRVATYTGDFRWLCKRHYDVYQPNIPDVIQP